MQECPCVNCLDRGSDIIYSVLRSVLSDTAKTE